MSALDEDERVIAAYKFASPFAPDVKRAKKRWRVSVRAMREIRGLVNNARHAEDPHESGCQCFVCLLCEIIDKADKESS